MKYETTSLFPNVQYQLPSDTAF